MDGEEDEEKGVVINMVVKEDDGQCKDFAAKYYCLVVCANFFPMLELAQRQCLRGIEKSKFHQLPVGS